MKEGLRLLNVTSKTMSQFFSNHTNEKKEKRKRKRKKKKKKRPIPVNSDKPMFSGVSFF